MAAQDSIFLLSKETGGQIFKFGLKHLGFHFKGSFEFVVRSSFLMKTGIELYKGRC